MNGSLTPTSSVSNQLCAYCHKQCQDLNFIYKLTGLKKEFCSESCLTNFKTKESALNFSSNIPACNGHTNAIVETGARTRQSDPKEKTTSNTDQMDEEPFSWDQYLSETRSVPAGPECFKQSRIPPVNEFKVDDKLEAVDPRSQSNCIATVICKAGSRVRLRLDGSDTKNDFWKMVDSSELHEYKYRERLGEMLQPPMGFIHNPTTWPKYLAKIMNGAQCAKSSCFKQEPRKPADNLFQVGMKLEAVDRKNPHLICVATVGEINGDSIRVTFDGWKGAFDYWCKYDDRDIFPVGWCAASGQPLQPPKQKQQPGKPKLSVTITEKNSSNSFVRTSPTSILEHKIRNPSPPSEPDSSRLQNVPSPLFNSSQPPVPPVVRPALPHLTVYVNKSKLEGQLGPCLCPEKVKNLPDAFGPDIMHRVTRMCIQKLIDACVNPLEALGLLRQGQSRVVITAASGVKLVTVRLKMIETVEEFWDTIEILFEELRCESFYEKAPPKSVTTEVSDTETAIDKQSTESISELSISESSMSESTNSESSSKKTSTLKLTFSASAAGLSPPLRRGHHGKNDTTGSDLTNISPDGTSNSPEDSKLRHRGRPKKKSKRNSDELSPKAIKRPIYHNSHRDFQEQEEAKRQRLASITELDQPPVLEPQLNTQSLLKVTYSRISTPHASLTSVANSATHASSIPNSDSHHVPATRHATVPHHSRPPSENTCRDRGTPPPVLLPFTAQPIIEERPSPVLSSNPKLWSIDQVVSYITNLDPTLATHSQLFRMHEIDGNALLLLTSDMMIKYMDMKLGPALKISNIVQMLMGKKHQPIP